MKHRIVTLAVLALIGILLVGSPVLAYVYRATYTVISANTTDFEMLGVSTDNGVNNLWMAANGFMNSTANDTRIETLGGLEQPHMVTDNDTFTAIPVPANSQTNLYFTTGNSEQDFYIIPGYGGYITVADNATLELGDNFTVTQVGWVDTTMPGLVTEDFTTYTEVDVNGKLTVTTTTATAVDADNDEDVYLYRDHGVNHFDALDIDFEIYMAGTSLQQARCGMAITNTVSAIVGFAATDISVVMHQDAGANFRVVLMRGAIVVEDAYVGAANTPYYCTLVRASGNDSVSVRIYTDTARTVLVDTLTLAGFGATRYQYSFGFVNYKGGAGGQDFDGYVKDLEWVSVRYLVSKSGAYLTYVSATGNITSIMVGTAASVTATGIPSDAGRRVTTADTVNMVISVYDAADALIDSDSIALAGATVPDNASDWYMYQNDAMPYSANLTLEVDGVRELWFQPNDIIVGTVLPDRAGGEHPGTFTWGANPLGVSVTMGGLVSAAQPSPGLVIEDPTPDIMPGVEVTDWYIEPDVAGVLLTFPLRPFVTILSDTTTLTELQAWRILGTALVLMVLVGVASAVRGHLLVAGVATSAVILGLVVLTIYPMWTLVFVVLAVVTGLISERTPSV